VPVRRANIKVGKKSYAYNGRMPLLDFLEAQGESVPSACRSGVCGACKCKVKGEVHSLSEQGLTRKDILAGYKLTCVSFPEGDLTVHIE
jgi:NADH oxidoreductase Hcr